MPHRPLLRFLQTAGGTYLPKTHSPYVVILLITVEQDKRSLGALELYTDRRTDTLHNSRLIVMIFIMQVDIDTAPRGS
jgi:hypothetical protein